ncbi:MAG TPA: hypothetical protein VK735_12640 [Pseudonocardia sp.]|jgi:hypothetical protein|uniref:hypothetical protein n=1 Tax=Pseudonocardia sp. TaxID=60912 RepID=UPI002B9CB54A|nr:hypothetical protein [Pseudonocardia sp.]HTF48289.1 hypothetical protein [Pseudonocardia sp.]
MSSELEALLDAEAEHAEQHRDEPAKPGTKVSKPGHARSTVFSVRLNSDEVAALQTLADESGLPPSTLVRSWILDGLENGGTPVGLRLRHLIREAVRDELQAGEDSFKTRLRAEIREALLSDVEVDQHRGASSG